MYDELAGVLVENDNEYVFSYDNNYKGKPISLSMPVNVKIHTSKQLHPFFKSLAPEGWLKKGFQKYNKLMSVIPWGF